MNKSTKSDNKRVKHWQRVSAATQFPKSSSTPDGNSQIDTRKGFAQGVKRIVPGKAAPQIVTEKAAEPNEAIRNWDNEGGTTRPSSPNPKL